MASPIVKVVRQEGDHVLVSLPLVGFPQGFEVKPGAFVVVYEQGGGLGGVARPLMREMVVQHRRQPTVCRAPR